MRAAVFSLLLLAAASAAAGPVFVLVDRKGDDYGAGDLIYPNREDLQRGDLDLVSFSAEPTQGGTLFHVEFARPVRDPRGVVTQVGQIPMERLARNGFYTFNVDVYIDTDRIAGSGRTQSIPGRGVAVDRQYAWEKAVVLTPRPEVAASILENQLLIEAEADLRAREGRASKYRLEFIAGELKKDIDSLYFFPTRVRVTGRAVEFFVPDSFLPGPVSRSWAYTAVVTGADLEQAGPPLGGSRRRAPMMTMGVATGITYDSFGIRSDVDPGVPPVVDLLAAGQGVQEAALNSYDVVAPRLAAVPGVAPDGRPATTPEGEALSPEDAKRIESVARGSAPPAAPSAPSGAAAAGQQPSGASAPRTVAQRLRELNQLLEDGLITPEEHAELRRKILAEL
jgi:hypothetical protein